MLVVTLDLHSSTETQHKASLQSLFNKNTFLRYMHAAYTDIILLHRYYYWYGYTAQLTRCKCAAVINDLTTTATHGNSHQQSHQIHSVMSNDSLFQQSNTQTVVCTVHLCTNQRC